MNLFICKAIPFPHNKPHWVVNLFQRYKYGQLKGCKNSRKQFRNRLALFGNILIESLFASSDSFCLITYHFMLPNVHFCLTRTLFRKRLGRNLSLGRVTHVTHWPQNMDGGQRRKIEAKRPPYWSSQKAVVTAVLSMKVLWDIQEDDPNNVFLIKKTCDKEQT